MHYYPAYRTTTTLDSIFTDRCATKEEAIERAKAILQNYPEAEIGYAYHDEESREIISVFPRLEEKRSVFPRRLESLNHSATMDRVNQLIKAGALFYVSHSGGKDSQAMYALLNHVVPHDQLVVVHADLGEIEWGGVQSHIHDTIEHPLHVVRASRTFLEMVEHRGMWPSAQYRQCTSDLKRGPIEKFIRNDMKARGADVAVNCTGIRAEESAARSRKQPWSVNKRLSLKSGARTVFDWMPIFHMATEGVFDTIARAGQSPHPAYEENERLSCVFCIMGSKNDLRHGARKNPELFRRIVELEQQIDHTMFANKDRPVGLEEWIGIKVEDLIAVA